MRHYLQHYGKERTGTNYLKSLLAANFTDLVLFDNRLGSKHEAFREVRTWMEERGVRSASDFADLLRTDPYWKARNVPSDAPFERVHQPVTYEELRALCAGRLPLGYLVSIKDPYAYAVSINRWKKDGLKRFQEPPHVVGADAELIRRHCLAFNAVYASYWPLIESGRGMLVRYEDLLGDAACTLGRIQRKFGLTARGNGFTDVEQTVAPTLGVSNSPFYRSFYRNREYLAALDAACLATVDQTINWELMRRYGYSSVSAGMLAAGAPVGEFD
ncbi:MAG: hypothetical protein ABSG65_04715 [Bryobacteraceae bacterium]